MSDQEDINYFDSILAQKYGGEQENLQERGRVFGVRKATAERQFGKYFPLDLDDLSRGSLYVDPRSSTGYSLTGQVEGQTLVSKAFASIIGDRDNTYQEHVDANSELSRDMMARGIFGTTNRARFVRKAQSEIGMARIMGILKEDEALSPHIEKFMNGGYGVSGAEQFVRGFAGAFTWDFNDDGRTTHLFHDDENSTDPERGISSDTTGDAMRGFNEVNEIINKRAEEMMGDQFRLERPLRDENGEIRLDADGKPKMEVVMDSFDPDKFYEYLEGHETLGPMLKDARISKDDLSGLRNIGDALESVSYKLFQGGQQTRAEATVQEGILGTMAKLDSFGAMIAQDPDIGVEIGAELGLSLGLAGLSGGLSLIAGGGRIGLKLANLAKKAYHVDKARKITAGGRAERTISAIGGGLRSASRIVDAVNIFRPGTTFGGNVAAFVARKYGANRAIREGAFIAGQMLDGAVGGGGAMISNNLFLAEEQFRLHGETSIRWNDHLGLGIGMGMAGATVLGYGMRTIGLSAVGKKTSDAWAKSEADLSQRIYGNPEQVVKGSGLSLKSKFNRLVNEIDYMLESRGISMKAEDFMKRAGFHEGNTNLTALHAALKRQVGDELGNPKSASELLARVAKDPEFIADNIGGKNLTQKQAKGIADMHAQATASAAKKSGGPDPELEARVAEAPEGKTRAEIVEELKAERIAEAEENISKAKQAKLDNQKKLQQDTAARQELETKGEDIKEKAKEIGKKRFNQKERKATVKEFEEAKAEAERLDAEIADAPLRDQDLDAQIAAHEARIDEINEGLYGGAGGKDSTEFDRIADQYAAVREAEEQVNIFAAIEGNVTKEGKLSEGFVKANKLDTNDPKAAAASMLEKAKGNIAKEAADPNFPTRAAMTTGASRAKVVNHTQKLQVVHQVAMSSPESKIFGKEVIADPATYTAPRVLDEDAAKAKTGELRKAAAEARAAAEAQPAPKADEPTPPLKDKTSPDIKAFSQLKADLDDAVAAGKITQKQADEFWESLSIAENMGKDAMKLLSRRYFITDESEFASIKEIFHVAIVDAIARVTDPQVSSSKFPQWAVDGTLLPTKADAPAPKADAPAPVRGEEPIEVKRARHVLKRQSGNKVQRDNARVSDELNPEMVKNPLSRSNRDLGSAIWFARQMGDDLSPENKQLLKQAEAELDARGLMFDEAPAIGANLKEGVRAYDINTARHPKTGDPSKASIQAVERIHRPAMLDKTTGELKHRGQVDIVFLSGDDLTPHGARVQTIQSPIGIGIARHGEEPRTIVKGIREAAAKFLEAEKAAKAARDADPEVIARRAEKLAAAQKTVDEWEASLAKAEADPSAPKTADSFKDVKGKKKGQPLYEAAIEAGLTPSEIRVLKVDDIRQRLADHANGKPKGGLFDNITEKPPVKEQSVFKTQADIDTDDIRALNDFLFNLESIAFGPTVRTATDDYGYVSEHALMAAAKDTGLITRSADGTVQGLDFRHFFVSQLKDPNAKTRTYNVQGIRDMIKDITDYSGRGRLENDAASVRRAQAGDLAASRAKRAGVAATKYAKANPDTPFAGGHTKESYRATVLDSLVKLYHMAEESGQGWTAVRNKVTQSKNKDKGAALMAEMEDILFRLADEGLEVESLGNGVKDFQNPHAVARALYDLEQGRVDGDTKVKKSRFDEGSSTFKEEATSRSATLSGVQPARDVEIAGVFDKLEYRHRLRAVYEMDFGQNGAPTFDEMMAFLRSGALKTSMGRAMDPERLTLASQIVPPQMRAGDALAGGIDKYLDDVVTSMLELPPTYLDMIHDDFGTLPRLMMQSLDSMEKTGEGWFGQVSMAGGFPFATPRMTEDGRPSMPMNAVHAAGLLFRGSWGDMLAADAAGRAAISKSADDFADLKGKALSDAAKEAGIKLSKNGKKLKAPELRQALADKANEGGSVFAIRNVDGSQNGVRWAIAAQENARTNGEIRIFERIEERLNNREGKKTGKVDFYLMVADATQAFIKNNPDKVSAELSLLTSKLGIFDKNSPNYKIGRSATKNPVMTLPYGAGKASVRAAFKNFLRTTELEIDGKKMTIAAYMKETSPSSSIDKMAKDMANLWYGQKNKQGQNLIEQGLKLLRAEEVNSIIAGNANMRSELSLGKLDPTKSLDDMAAMAKRMADEGLVENETQAFMALQARAHANSMFQIAQDPKYTALISAYRDAKKAKMAIIAEREAALQSAGAQNKNEVYASFEKRLEVAEASEVKILDDLNTQMAYRQHGLGEAATAKDLDLSGNMKRDPMILEVVERLSNRQLAQELKLIYRTFDEDPQVASQAMKELSEAVQNQELPFFDRATKALNRTVFSVPDNAKIAMQQKQTGITSGPFLPKEADGIFQQTLNDHRGRVVTPQTLHAAFKAKKSQRGLMDLHAIMEEADMVTFKTSKAEAEADLKNEVIAGRMSDDEWVNKHLDPEGTFGIGYWDFVDTGDLSLRASITRDVTNGTDVAVAAQVHRATKGLSPDNEHVIKLANWESIDRTTSGGQKELIDALVGANTQRIKQLGVKNILAMGSAYGAPPVVKDADGTIGYLPSRTADELYDDWAAASGKINDAKTRAIEGGIDFDKLSPEAQAAYRKSNGDPFKAAQTHGIVDESGLARTIGFEAESKALAEAASKGEDTPDLYFADKMQGGIMHGLELHPTEHMNAMLGIPALREHAFNRAKQADGTTRTEGMGAVHVRNMNEGRGIIAPEYKNTEHGVAFDGLANRGVTALNSEAIRGMRTDMADQSIAKFLQDHARRYGLEGMDEVEIYQHRLVQENLMAYRRDQEILQKQLEDPKNKGRKEEIISKMRDNSERFIRALQETDEDVQVYLREAWDTASLVPRGAAGGTYRYNVQKGILGSLEDSAMLSARTDDPQVAAERTNMYLTGRVGGGDRTDMAVDLGVPGARPTGTDRVAYFARGVETDVEGNIVTLKDTMDNRNAAVTHTHNTDSAHVFITAGMAAGEPMLGGIRTVRQGMDMEDLSALWAVDPLLGHKGSVSFRDAIGRQIVNPEMVGRNARRIHGRDEVAYLLNNSQNRYVGEALELSASTAGPDGKGPVVRQRRSAATLMDDRVAKKNRNVMMEIAEEQRLVTNYLQRKYPDKMGKDSFSGRAFLPKSLSEEPEILSSVFRTMAEDRRTGILDKLELIDPALAGAFRLDKNKSPSLKDGLKTVFPFERGVPNKRTFTDGVMDEAIEAWGLLNMAGRPDSMAARMTYDAAQQAKINAVVARFNLQGGDTIKVTKGWDAYKAALEKHFTDNEIEVAGFRDDGTPIAKTIDDLSEDAMEALSLLRKQDNYLKNLGGDFAAGALMDGYSSTMLKFMFDATDLTPSRMEIRKAVLANEPLTPKQKEEVFDFLTNHDHSQIGTSSNKYTAEYGEPIVDTAVAAAKKAYEASEEFGNEVAYGYKGDFVDHTGKPQPPEYFQNASKYRALSAAHKSLDDQLEGLIEAGVLTVPQVRLLRSATAAIDPKVLDGIKMDFVTSTSGKARQGKITTTKFQQTITLLKDRLGDDFSAVDVVMHEIGHASFNRMMRDKSGLLRQFTADANTPQAKEAMRNILSVMYGGETKQARKAMKAMGVENQTQKTDVEEFAAQWFSFVMQQEAFGNPATINAAYKGLDKAQKGLGTILKQMVEAMVSYGIRRFKRMSSLFKRVDASTAERMNTYVDVMRGKTDLAPAEHLHPGTKYYGGDNPFANIQGKITKEGMEPEFNIASKDYRMAEIAAEAAAKQASAESSAAKAAAGDVDSANPFAGISGRIDMEGGKGNGPKDPSGPSGKSPEGDADGPERIFDFDRGVREDDPMAWRVFMEEILPFLDHGRAPKFDYEAKALADELGWSMGEKYAVAALGQDFMMPFAKTNHTYKSQVTVNWGDARYAIMPLLADLLDTHTSGSTQATFNGRPFKSLTQVAREAESRTVGRMTELAEELRIAINKDEGKLGLLKEFESQEAKLAREDVARTAVLLLAPTDSKAYAKGKAKFDAAGPETQKVLTKMSKKFREISAETKRNAVEAGMMTNTRAIESGLVPIMLRQEHMADKGPWAKVLRDEYQAQLRARADEVQDVDGLIAVGLLPAVNKSRTSMQEFEAGIQNLIERGILDRSILDAKVEFDGSPARLNSTSKRRLVDMLGRHHKGSKSTDVMHFQNFLGPQGKALFDKYKKSIDDASLLDSKYMAARRADVQERTKPRYGDKVSSKTDNGIADLRQFTLNRKVGSSAYYYGGDKFISNHDFFLKFGDEFIEADPSMLAASIHRGIGLDAMDAKNLSQMVPGVKGITTRNLLDLTEKISVENSNSPIKTSLEHGINQLRAAREQLGGGRPAQEMTGSAFHDFMNRHTNSATMVLFGGNMGLAMLAETASVMTLKAAPMFVASPVRTTARILQSLTASLSPMRKAELLKHASYAMHEMRGQHSVSTIAGTIDRSTDASLGAAGQQTNRFIDGLGTLAYRFGGGSTVQAFNKDLAMRLHIDSLYDKTKAIRRLKDGMAAAELNGLGQNKESFVRLAREAGFGGDWHLAVRMLRSGVTEHIDQILTLADKTGTSKDRTFNFDAIDRWISDGGSMRRDEYQAARQSLWNFLDDSVSRFMVEPRVLDMNLTENRAWNRFMDIFMSWPRAFAGQKGFGASKAGRQNIGIGHLVGFATAQIIWDSIYTTIQEIARGEDPNKIQQQVEQDPVGWFMQKATRLPMTGAMGSQVGSVVVDYLRNMAAKMSDGDVGYAGSNSFGIDWTGSPGGGALKSVTNAMGAGVSLIEDLVFGTISQRSAARDFGQIMKLVPLFNSLYAKAIGQMVMGGEEGMEQHKSLAHYESEYRKKIIKMQQERLAR